MTLGMDHLPPEDVDILFENQEARDILSVHATCCDRKILYINNSNSAEGIAIAAKVLGISKYYTELLRWAFSDMNVDVLRLDEDGDIVSFLPTFNQEQKGGKQ